MQLTPGDNGGTELSHEVWVKPRGIIGRVATYFELDQKTGKNLRTVYERIDQCVVDGKGEDPFETAAKPTGTQRRSVERAVARLTEGGFDPPLVSQLAEFVLVEPAKRLERMRPYELADAWGVDRPGMLDLLIHAAYAGLLELSWDAVCPRCRIAHESWSTGSRLGAPGGGETRSRPSRRGRDRRTFRTPCTCSPAPRGRGS